VKNDQKPKKESTMVSSKKKWTERNGPVPNEKMQGI
jgi:hypothetical protein